MNFRKRKADGFTSPFKRLFFLVVAVLIGAALPAQTAAQKQPVRLTPDEAVEQAVKSNLSLESSKIGTAVKKRASDMWWNQFIPSVTVAGIMSIDNEAAQISGLAPVTDLPLNSLFGGMLPSSVPNIYGVVPYSVDAPQWHIAGTIQASLTLNYVLLEAIKRLRMDYEGGLLGYDKARAQLERDVRKSYHGMLLLQENIALLRGSYENVERQVQMAQANYNAGLAPELVVLQAQVARENMKPLIDQAENGLKLSMAQFAMFLGLSYETPFELVPIDGGTVYIPLDVTDLIKKASLGKPDIRELKHNMLMLENARRMQWQTLTPSLTLSWNNTSAFIKDPWKDTWFGNKDDWRNSGAFTISVGMRLHSLIPYSQDFQGIKALDDQIRMVSIGLAQMVYGTEIEVYNTVLALEKTRTSMEAMEQTVNMAQRSYQLTEQAYQAGLQDLFQVQNAEMSLRQARVQMLEQQFNYLNGLIDLEYSIGVPFGTLRK